MPAEIKILERAEMYLRKLSCGVNPLNEAPLAETDICKQERISKCLTYVADYLKQKVFLNTSKPEKQVSIKQPRQAKQHPARELATKELEISPEALSKFEITEEAVSVSGLIRRINATLVQDSGMMPLIYADVAEVLSQEGILQKQENDKGKDSNLPTPHGEELGFSRTEADIRGHHAVFTKCSAEAQKFVIDNIQKCADLANARLAKRKAAEEEKAAKASEGLAAETDCITTTRVRPSKEKFHLTEEQISKYPSDETPVPVTEIARRLNDLLTPEANIEKIYFKSIRDWFVAQNFLEEKKSIIGKMYFTPTESGASAGIVTEQRIGKNGEAYDAVLYNFAAQKLVLDHVNELR